nr:hypothetical protein [Tanacetum cinerariifolium]
MIAILEKYEHNVDFHLIVDFVEASYIRVETSDEGTKILATLDGKPRTIYESSIRRNLKLNDEARISSLSDAELFENLTLMGYNISPNHKFTFQKGQFSHQWKYLIHTIMQCLSPKSTGFNEFSSNMATVVTDIPTLRQYSWRARIAQSLALPTAVNEPASPFKDDSQSEACPTIYGLEVEQDRVNIIKTSTLPYDSPPRVTSLAADEGTQDLEIISLMSRIKMLEDTDGGVVEPSREDATIKGRSLETGEEAGVDKSTERGSNDIKELVNVLTSLDALNILTSEGVQVDSVPPTTEVSTVSVPTGSGKEKMVESDTPKKKKLPEQIDVQMAREMEEQLAREDQRMSEQIARDAEIARIHAEEELKMLIDSLDGNNETIAKYLQEYEQFAADLDIEERIKLINDLGMSEIREKFIPVWKQIEDFVPMGSKEEGDKVKSKGLRLEHESAKKVKTSEEVSEEDLKTMMQLVPVDEVYVEALQVKHLIIDLEIHTEGKRTYWKITRLGGNTAVYQFFVDMLKHFDREDLN